MEIVKNTTRFVPLEKIYERILYYKDKQNDQSLILNEYMVSVLEGNTIISFASPRGISVVLKDSDGQMYTDQLEFDEAINLLKLHLRTKKIKKLKNEKERGTP